MTGTCHSASLKGLVSSTTSNVSGHFTRSWLAILTSIHLDISKTFELLFKPSISWRPVGTIFPSHNVSVKSLSVFQGHLFCYVAGHLSIIAAIEWLGYWAELAKLAPMAGLATWVLCSATHLQDIWDLANIFTIAGPFIITSVLMKQAMLKTAS